MLGSGGPSLKEANWCSASPDLSLPDSFICTLLPVPSVHPSQHPQMSNSVLGQMPPLMFSTLHLICYFIPSLFSGTSPMEPLLSQLSNIKSAPTVMRSDPGTSFSNSPLKSAWHSRKLLTKSLTGISAHLLSFFFFKFWLFCSVSPLL